MPLMRCLRIADGLKTMTRLGEIGTSVPVFGFRPIRWPFFRTMNDPKDDSFTVSPFFKGIRDLVEDEFDKSCRFRPR